MAESRTVMDIIDADGCIYNVVRYYRLVLWLCSHYGELDLTPEILPELEDSLTEFMKHDFAEADFNKFQAHCVHLQRQLVRNLHGQKLAEFEELGLDIGDPDIQNQVDSAFPLDRPDKYYAIVYINSCIEKFNQVDARIMNIICEHANVPLLTRMKGNAKAGDVYYIAVGSLRQGYGHDKAGMRVNGTNSVFSDLTYFSTLLRKHHGNQGARAAFYPLTVTDIQASLMRGENLRRIMSQLNGTHNSYFCDPSKILILYALIHDVVAQAATPRYVFNFYDNELPLLQGVMQVFGKYPELLPEHVILNLHGYDGDFMVTYELRGAGPIDHNYRENLALMLKLAIDNAGDLEKESISIAENVDFEYFLQERDLEHDPVKILIAGIDADDCFYNKKFIKALRFVLGTLGKEIEEALASDNEEIKSEVARKLKSEITYAHSIDAPYAHDWYKALDVADADLHSAVRSRKTKTKKRHALQCQYLRYMRRLDPGIITHLLFVTNETLFSRIVASAKVQKCEHIELYNISARQCHEDDLRCAIQNGVGLINEDLSDLAIFLDHYYDDQDLSFSYAEILMSDLYSRSHPGLSLKNQKNNWLCDTSLLSVFYFFTHYAVNCIYPVMAFECYSANIGSMEALFARLSEENNDRLLPANLPLRFLAYNGKFEGGYQELTGAGEVDVNLYDSLECMVNLCEMEMQANYRAVRVDILTELSITAFIEKRKQQRSRCLQQFENLIQLEHVEKKSWRVPGLFAAAEKDVKAAQHLPLNRPPYH